MLVISSITASIHAVTPVEREVGTKNQCIKWPIVACLLGVSIPAFVFCESRGRIAVCEGWMSMILCCVYNDF